MLPLFATFFQQRCRVACLQRSWLPMVQLVRGTMAVTALGKTCHHAGRVRHAVAVLAGRYILVLVLVAGNTEYVLMLGIAAGELLERTLMAGGTHLVGRIGRHEYRRRLMGLMAFFTLRSNHIGAVRFVALRTEWNLAVNIMTETACQSAMLALDLLQFDDLFGMTGQTLFGDVIGQFDDLGGMRIGVAPLTVGQVVVHLAGMTLAADRDDLFYCRRVTGMTVLTPDTRLMRAAVGRNISRRSRMTLDAVCCQQSRPVGSIRKNCQRTGQQG